MKHLYKLLALPVIVALPILAISSTSLHAATVQSAYQACLGDSRNDIDFSGDNSSVRTPRDFVLKKAYTAENIKNSKADRLCRGTHWNKVGQPEHATMQDFVAARCKRVNYSCNDVENFRRNYKVARDSVTEKFRGKIPTADEFFSANYLDNLAFNDINNKLIQIPRQVLLYEISHQSRGYFVGAIPHILFPQGGLFQIRDVSRRVTYDIMTKSGKTLFVVSGLAPRGDDFEQNPRYPDEYSLYHPHNNWLRFGANMQTYYRILQTRMNGKKGQPNFDDLTVSEKWKFVLYVNRAGGDLVKLAVKRLAIFNKAMQCNSCAAFNPEGNSCQTIKIDCADPVANACNKTLPFDFSNAVRFMALREDNSSPLFRQHMFCLVKQHFQNYNVPGPCYVADGLFHTIGLDFAMACR